MKIKDIINNINKSKEFEDEVDSHQMAEALGLNEYDFEFAVLEKMKSYYYGSWFDTDSSVGFKVYFYYDEPVAISSQKGRKQDVMFKWLSKDSFEKVKKYILTFRYGHEEDNIFLLDENEDIDEGYVIQFCNELFDYHLKMNVLYNGLNCRIIKKEEKKKGSYGIERKVEIQFEDSSLLWVDVYKLIFPYNVNK